MSYSMQVIFKGACAFVPDKPLFVKVGKAWEPNKDNPKRIAVLMPDLLSPNLTSWTQGFWPKERTFRAPHLPYLVFPKDSFVSITGPGPHNLYEIAHVFQDASQQHFALLPLLHEHVSLPNLGTPIECVRPVYEKSVPETDKEKESLWWVPHMERISDRKQDRDVRAELNPFTTEFDFEPTPLAGSVKIFSGKLSLKALHKSMSGEVNSWEFGDVDWSFWTGNLTFGKPIWSRAIGNQILLDLTPTQDYVEIKLFRFYASAEDPRTLTLSCKSPLVCEIRHTEPEIAFLPSRMPLTKELPDPDFEGYYQLTAKPKPGPVPVRVDDSGSGDSLRPCSPNLFRGFIGS